ncbi:MAG TPA: type VI secretion system tip protein TssI/VgrG, partial [Candidatus Paceibacterota bacterium]|nr:type VI secretion system tip protein TssI/VgrG [Candidatus Paceibacterota bacterium]
GSLSNITLTGSLYLPNTTNSAGGIYFGGTPVIQSLANGDFFAGAGAGNFAMTGRYNTGVGSGALDADTSGNNNSAFGFGALGAVTAGSENTAAGVNALSLNANGNQNAAFGAAALYKNSGGAGNTAVGYEALFSTTNGANNTALGYKTLFVNATGTNNIAVGWQAGYNLVAGNNNIAIGNLGAASDNGIIRIGTAGIHTNTILAGTIFGDGGGLTNLTPAQLAIGSISGDKIAPGSIKVAQIDDGGSADYQAFLGAVHAISTNASIAFTRLLPVPATNGISPAFALTVGGASPGTVCGFSGTEEISRPYCFVVQVQSSGAVINPDAQLGLAASLTYSRNGRTTRFGGIVTACARSASSRDNLLYTYRIEPALVKLGYTTDYRVNQDISAPVAAKSVYEAITGSTVTDRLDGSYAVHENLIQYAESDLNFFSRILENEGAFYFFDQSVSPPGLVLADSPTGYASAPFSPYAYYGDTSTNLPLGTDFIRSFQTAGHQSILKSSVGSYDFGHPTTIVLKSSVQTKGAGEQYDFGTGDKAIAYVSKLADVRRDRQIVERLLIAGSGTAADLRPGSTFTLNDSTGAGLTGTYLVTAVTHAGYVRMTNGVATLLYGNEFQVIPSEFTFRPARQTPQPQALPCTAVVTGPSGEEIFVDQHGRAKVQFHWDRYGAKNENSSAWLRVAMPMAGANGRGMMFLPRVGDEVLVSFVQGDPDQPVITGSFFNANNPPPYQLPAHKTVSTIRSIGSKAQPDVVNEIEFDDLAGSQLFNLRAAKDMNVTVNHDLTLSVANDFTIATSGNFVVGAGTHTTFSGPLAADNATIQTCSASNLTLAGNLYLPNATNGTGGIYFGGSPVIKTLANGDFFAGLNAGNTSMSGRFNTGIGALALDAATTGGNNSAFGYGALGADTSGGANTAVGVNALAANSSGDQNTALGAAALYRTTVGSGNAAVGYEALFNSTTGSNNIALGNLAGFNLTTGNNNIVIGNSGVASDSGIIRLGTPGTHTNTFLAGTLFGDAGGLTNLNAAQLAGTVPDARLTANVSLLNTAQTFTAEKGFSAGLRLNDADVYLRPGTDTLHGIGWYGSPKTFGGVNVNGPVLYGNGGGALGAINGSANIALQWDSSRNVAINGVLLLGSSVFLNDKDLLLRSDNNHGLGWFGSGKLFAGVSPDGPVMYGYSGGGLGILRSGSATNLVLTWNSSGNVGIGNANPTNRLMVANARCDGSSWINASDRNLKQDFQAVDPLEILAKVASMPVQTWSYRTQPGQKHLGPVAQDFHATFGLGADDVSIATVDESGVALAAIQGLNRKIEEKDAEIRSLKAQNELMEKRFAELESLVRRLTSAGN